MPNLPCEFRTHRLGCQRDEEQERHHDPGQKYRQIQLALDRRVARKEQLYNAGREDGPDQADRRHKWHQQRSEPVGERVSVLLTLCGQRLRIRGDERGRQRTLCQQVTEQVGNPVRRHKCVVDHAGTKKARERDFAHEARDPAEEYGEADDARLAHYLSMGGIRVGHRIAA